MLNNGPLGALVNAPRMAAAICTSPGQTGLFTQSTTTSGGKLPASMIEFSRSALTALRTPGVLSYCSEISAPLNGWKSWTETLMVMVELTGAVAWLGSTVRILENAWAGVGRIKGERPASSRVIQVFRRIRRLEKTISLS